MLLSIVASHTCTRTPKAAIEHRCPTTCCARRHSDQIILEIANPPSLFQRFEELPDINIHINIIRVVVVPAYYFQ